MPKVINKKKVFIELCKKFGLREERVKEFGLVEQEDETHPESSQSHHQVQQEQDLVGCQTLMSY